MEGMSRVLRAAVIFFFVFFYNLAAGFAATEYLPEHFFFHPADVNGDRLMDAIAQPRRPGRDAAVLLGSGTDAPETFWQRLSDLDPSLSWDRENTEIIVGDFNGDGRDDLYLQGRQAESRQAILLANEAGRFTGVQQTFAGEYMGFEWAAEYRRAAAGDFDGNGRAALLMQGQHPDDIHLIVHPNVEGQLNTTGASWVDSHLGLRWNASQVELYVGDFNGDGSADLLWRRNANSPAVGAEPAVALLLSDGSGGFNEISQEWEKDFLGAEWDPATHDIRIADINGDGIVRRASRRRVQLMCRSA